MKTLHILKIFGSGKRLYEITLKQSFNIGVLLQCDF